MWWLEMALTAAQTAADYMASMDRVGETVSVRRYTGLGVARTYADFEARARTVGYEPQPMISSHNKASAIQQGDRKIILLAADLDNAGFASPITTDDKVMVRGMELAIIAADDSTRRVNGTLIAYELQVRG